MTTLIMTRQSARLAPFGEWLGPQIEQAHLFVEATRAREYSGFRAVHPFEDYETSALVELDALRLGREQRVDRIVATSETDILRAARLRTCLSIPGQRWDSALAFRNKLVMKRQLDGRARQVRVPAYREVIEAFDIIQFIEEQGYPAIVKPIDGFNTIGATVLRNDGDLRALLGGGIGRGLEIERLIEGDMFHVDGFVADGELLLCWPSRYVRDLGVARYGGALDRARAPHTWTNAGYMLPPGSPLTMRLRDAAEEILRLMPTPPSTSFHLELFLTSNDEIFFCEIASRTAGAFIAPMLEQAFGINLTALFVQAQAGILLDRAALRRGGRAPRRLLGWGIAPPERGVFAGSLNSAPSQPWMVRHEWSLAKGTRSTGAHLAGDRVAAFLVEIDQERDAPDRLATAWRWSLENAIWEQDVAP